MTSTTPQLSPAPHRPVGEPRATAGSFARDALILTCLFGLLLSWRSGAPLANPDEGRYAEIAREMLVTGDWVTPRLNQVYYFEKPPLVYWCTAASFKLFGVKEWAARLPITLFALLGILVTYAAARRIHSRTAGLAAAGVLGTSLLYFILGRILILDMPVSVLMSTALFCFLLGVREQPGRTRRLLFYALYVSAALATLAKGLIGFLVTGAVIFLWLLIFNQWRRLRPFYLPSGALIFLAIATPWHVLAAQRNPEWTEFYFFREHWLRFTTTTHGRHEPWWYFIPIVLAGLFPWAGGLWQALRDAFKGGWKLRKETADTWFLLLWAAFIFLFFSRSQSKLPPYVLPLFPAMAVLLGAWLARLVSEGPWQRLKPTLWTFSIGTGLVALAALVLAAKPSLIRERDLVEAARVHAVVLGTVLIAGVVAAWQLARKNRPRSCILAIVGTFAVFYLVVAETIPLVIHRNTKALAHTFTALAAPSDRVYHYNGFFHDFVFHTGRPVGTVNWPDELELDIDVAARESGRFIQDAQFLTEWGGPTRVWAVARKRNVRELFARADFHYHLIAETRSHYLFSNQP